MLMPPDLMRANAPAPPAARRDPLGLVLAATATLALLVPTLLVRFGPAAPRIALRVKLPPKHVVPPTELPDVEPVQYAELTVDDARSYNAAIPFSTAPNPAARPFRMPGDTPERARALDCLATAALYEAGDDGEGQRAVVQVVLNRLRHPAFPKTICGVVFQGSERRTGCQFTFTCDGNLERWRWSDAAWTRARAVAGAALAGAVFRPVGHSTHYHTDWVVPYWQASLDKVAKVGTHLFFRWSGWWGTPGAFNRRVDPDEPVIARLARYSPAHAADAGALLADGVEPGTLPGLTQLPPAESVAGDPNAFIIAVKKSFTGDELPAIAAYHCGDRPYCKFFAWTDAKAKPAVLPLGSREIASMSFSYLRDRARGFDKPLWNCTQYLRPDPSQCMKTQLLTDPREAVRAASGGTAAPAEVVEERPRSPRPAEPARASGGLSWSLTPGKTVKAEAK